MTRSWRMFAARNQPGSTAGEFGRFGDERTVRFKGGDPVEVELTEDPNGQYWGYIRLPSSRVSERDLTGAPLMIWGHEGMFRMQSPDGFRSDVEHGRGEIVRMSCRAVDAS
ncbi:hypothetical protein AB0F72_08565 [Actinoplanes sp. NPDC023936]|uniref:hypothetical protein n=1 Tax=Actinoplanes sp. NPDC023936 TaxID=3154910 RepID=UPI0033C8A0FD